MAFLNIVVRRPFGLFKLAIFYQSCKDICLFNKDQTSHLKPFQDIDTFITFYRLLQFFQAIADDLTGFQESLKFRLLEVLTGVKILF